MISSEVRSAAVASMAIRTFARLDSGMVSVELNSLEFVTDTLRYSGRADTAGTYRAVGRRVVNRYPSLAKKAAS
jgi:hypothetical protein